MTIDNPKVDRIGKSCPLRELRSSTSRRNSQPQTLIAATANTRQSHNGSYNRSDNMKIK